jgi:hypothetical protein
MLAYQNIKNKAFEFDVEIPSNKFQYLVQSRHCEYHCIELVLVMMSVFIQMKLNSVIVV